MSEPVVVAVTPLERQALRLWHARTDATCVYGPYDVFGPAPQEEDLAGAIRSLRRRGLLRVNEHHKVYGGWPLGEGLTLVLDNVVPSGPAASADGPQVFFLADDSAMLSLQGAERVDDGLLHSAKGRLVISQAGGTTHITFEPYTTTGLQAGDQVYIHQEGCDGLARVLRILDQNTLVVQPVGSSFQVPVQADNIVWPAPVRGPSRSVKPGNRS